MNYSDANSGAYTLPEPLKLANGKTVQDGKTWRQKRRPEIVKLFEDLQFGRTPAPKPSTARPSAVGILKSLRKPAQSIAAIMRKLTFNTSLVFDYLRITQNSIRSPVH